MSPTLLILLRLLHVLGGAFWFGAALLNTAFLGPGLRAAGPAGGDVMRQMVQVRRLPLWINGAAMVTMLSGIWLYGWRSSWFSAAGWVQSSGGLTFGVGGVFAITAAVIGGAFIGRSAKAMGQIGKAAEEEGRPTTEAERAEMGRLQRRMGKASVVATALIFLATMCMAVARYV